MDNGNPVKTDSIPFVYDEKGRITEKEFYRINEQGELKFLVRVLNEYDESGRLIRATRPEFSRTVYHYDENGNLIRRDKKQYNPETDEYELQIFRTYTYGEVKNPYYQKELPGLNFAVHINRRRSPNAPIGWQNFNTITDDLVAEGTIEYETNEDGFPTKSRIVFKNLDGVSKEQ